MANLPTSYIYQLKLAPSMNQPASITSYEATLHDFGLHELEDPDRTYRRQRTAGDISDTLNDSALFSVNKYVPGPLAL